MRRWSGSAWVPFVARSAAGAVLPWPRVVPLPDVEDLFDHYVSTDGSSSNDGSLASPWSLAYAYSGAGGAIQPGDTVGIREGHYITPQGTEWKPTLSGTAEARITFRAYPGERVILDSADTTAVTVTLQRATGSYLDFWGLEWQFTGSLIRTSAMTGSDASDIGGRDSKDVVNVGAHNRYINCIVHDCADGFGDQSVTTSWDNEYYGCLIYNGGWWGPDRGHGHAFYVQSKDPSGKRIRDTVCFGQFSTGIKFAGSGDAWLKYLTIQGVCSFNHEMYGGGGGDASLHLEGGGSTGAGPVTAEDSIFWSKSGLGTAVKFNSPSDPPLSAVTFRRNVVVGQPEFNECDAHTIEDNLTTYLQDPGPGKRAMNLRMESGQSYTAHTIDRNTYVQPAAKYPWGLLKPTGTTAIYNSVATWNAETGYDANGILVDALKPATSEILYRPNEFETGRGWIYCLNWEGSASLDVDLSQVGLTVGDDYTVHHVYDVFGDPVASGTYDGNPLALNQEDYVPPTPLGWEGDAPASASPHLNVFLVRPV